MSYEVPLASVLELLDIDEARELLTNLGFRPELRNLPLAAIWIQQTRPNGSSGLFSTPPTIHEIDPDEIPSSLGF